MTRQEALRILMLSPFYFQMPLEVRNDLLQEFCRNFQEANPRPDNHVQLQPAK